MPEGTKQFDIHNFKGLQSVTMVAIRHLLRLLFGAIYH